MMDTLEIRHLRLVRAIVEEGGATRAAARLHLTQSAVSRQLAELEGRLGVALFLRVRRRLVPTSAGQKMAEAARELLGELGRVERELTRAGAPAKEPLRLAVESFTSYPFFAALHQALAASHPHIEPRIVLEASREPLVALLRGTIDLAIVSSSVRDRKLVTTALLEDEWAVIVAADHPLARRAFVSAKELGAEVLLTHDAPRSDVERLRAHIAAERAAMPATVRIPLTEVLVALVAAGRGVGLVSRWAVSQHLAHKEIVARRFTREGIPERWFAVYRREVEDRLPLAEATAVLQRTHLGTRPPSSRKTRPAR